MTVLEQILPPATKVPDADNRHLPYILSQYPSSEGLSGTFQGAFSQFISKNESSAGQSGTCSQERTPPRTLTTDEEQSGTSPQERTPSAAEKKGSNKCTRIIHYKPQCAAKNMPMRPRKLSEYEKPDTEDNTLKAIKERGKQKTLSSNKRSTQTKDAPPLMVPETQTLTRQQEYDMHMTLQSICICPTEQELFLTWSPINIYLRSHKPHCPADPNKGKEIYNNRIRQVYLQQSLQSRSHAQHTLTAGSTIQHTLESGTIRRLMLPRSSEEFCYQVKQVDVEGLHRIVFQEGISKDIIGELGRTNAYISESGMVMLMEAYIRRLEKQKLIPENKVVFSPALWLLLQNNMANQLGDAKLTFPTDESLTPEILLEKQKLVTQQYDDRSHDFFAPMIWNLHWYLVLIKTEPHIPSEH